MLLPPLFLLLSNFLFFIVTLEVFVCTSIHLIRSDSVWCPNSFKFFSDGVSYAIFVLLKILISKYYLVWSECSVYIVQVHVYGCVFSNPNDKTKTEAIEQKHIGKEATRPKRTGNVESAPKKITGISCE